MDIDMTAAHSAEEKLAATASESRDHSDAVRWEFDREVKNVGEGLDREAAKALWLNSKRAGSSVTIIKSCDGRVVGKVLASNREGVKRVGRLIIEVLNGEAPSKLDVPLECVLEAIKWVDTGVDQNSCAPEWRVPSPLPDPSESQQSEPPLQAIAVGDVADAAAEDGDVAAEAAAEVETDLFIEAAGAYRTRVGVTDDVEDFRDWCFRHMQAEHRVADKKGRMCVDLNNRRGKGAKPILVYPIIDYSHTLEAHDQAAQDLCTLLIDKCTLRNHKARIPGLSAVVDSILEAAREATGDASLYAYDVHILLQGSDRANAASWKWHRDVHDAEFDPDIIAWRNAFEEAHGVDAEGFSDLWDEALRIKSQLAYTGVCLLTDTKPEGAPTSMQLKGFEPIEYGRSAGGVVIFESGKEHQSIAVDPASGDVLKVSVFMRSSAPRPRVASALPALDSLEGAAAAAKAAAAAAAVDSGSESDEEEEEESDDSEHGEDSDWEGAEGERPAIGAKKPKPAPPPSVASSTASRKAAAAATSMFDAAPVSAQLDSVEAGWRDASAPGNALKPSDAPLLEKLMQQAVAAAQSGHDVLPHQEVLRLCGAAAAMAKAVGKQKAVAPPAPPKPKPKPVPLKREREAPLPVAAPRALPPDSTVEEFVEELRNGFTEVVKPKLLALRASGVSLSSEDGQAQARDIAGKVTSTRLVAIGKRERGIYWLGEPEWDRLMQAAHGAPFWLPKGSAGWLRGERSKVRFPTRGSPSLEAPMAASSSTAPPPAKRAKPAKVSVVPSPPKPRAPPAVAPPTAADIAAVRDW